MLNASEFYIPRVVKNLGILFALVDKLRVFISTLVNKYRVKNRDFALETRSSVLEGHSGKKKGEKHSRTVTFCVTLARTTENYVKNVEYAIFRNIQRFWMKNEKMKGKKMENRWKGRILHLVLFIEAPRSQKSTNIHDFDTRKVIFERGRK